MATKQSASEARQARLAAQSHVTATKASRLFDSAIDGSNLDASWLALAPTLNQQITQGQTLLLAGSDRYAAGQARFDGLEQGLTFNPAPLIGRDGSGRPLDTLAHGAVTTTKQQIARGVAVNAALEAGSVYLYTMIRTALLDVARQSDMGAASAKGYTYYVRVVSPGACERCLVLAGATQFGPFLRHPDCKCTVQPMTRDQYEDYNPWEHVNQEDLARRIGKDSAQAIADGADPIQVINARRGALRGVSEGGADFPRARMVQTQVGTHADGTPVMAWTTLEGTTRRGYFGRMEANLYNTPEARAAGARYSGTQRHRFMPRTIYQVTNDPAERRALLIDSGYISPAQAFPGFPGAAWRESAQQNRRIADAIYLRNGITPIRSN